MAERRIKELLDAVGDGTGEHVDVARGVEVAGDTERELTVVREDRGTDPYAVS